MMHQKMSISPKQRNENVAAKALLESVAFVVLLAVCFVLPSFAALFEGEQAEWTQDEIGRHRRVHWPLLKDPDSLLSIQAALRVLLFFFTISFSWNSRTSLGFGSTCSAMLFLVSYLGRLGLFAWKEFHLEGPIGGRWGLGLEFSVMMVVLVQLVLSFCGPRGVRGGLRSSMSACLVAPFLLTFSAYLGWEHYITIAKEEAAPLVGDAGRQLQNANAIFSFVHIVEVFGTLIFLLGHIGLRAKGSRIRRGLILALTTTQAGCSLLYFLDSFDLSPQSTMAWGAQIPADDLAVIDGKG